MFLQIKDLKHIKRDFVMMAESCPRVGRQGVPRESKIIFFEHGHVAYQINGDDERNRIQIKFSL